MTEKELQTYLLDNYPKEDESCEWKEMKKLVNHFDGKASKDVLSYVSAIANMEGGVLIIGVVDGTLEIVGTDITGYTTSQARLRLRERCANLVTEGLDIEEVVTEDTRKTVWIIHIPKHSARRPVYAHSKAWQRLGENLIEMTPERLDAILSEPIAGDDWSAAIIEDATIEDLDPRAIAKAREKFLDVNPRKADELATWDDVTFLNKAKFTRKGRITNTAIILLGREESEHLISPAVCKIRWKLIAKDDPNKDFRIFSIPMILAVDEIKDTIRNTSYVYTVSGSIFPENMMRYDVFTLREPINNAIAHQDYSKRARIEVMEYEDEKLVFVNKGQFIPKSIEEVITNDCPESVNRNPFLVEAMRNVNMVETEGGGIRKLFNIQKKRFFPMPTYDLSNQEVRCEIQGKVLDENFAKILINNQDLSLPMIVLLDKVQKREQLSDDAIALLRKKKFVEGRKTNLFLSYKVVSASKHVDLKTSYIKNKSFDDSYYKQMIMSYITKFKSASRSELDILLGDKLPDVLTERQKYDKLTNLLASLRKEEKIYSEKKRWFVVE